MDILREHSFSSRGMCLSSQLLGRLWQEDHCSLEVQGLGRQERRHFLKTNKQAKESKQESKLQQESRDPLRDVLSFTLTALQAS